MYRFLITALFSLIALLPLSAQDSTHLKVISWNIQDFGRSKDKKEIRQIAEYLRDYDLVAIQEVAVHNTNGPKAVARLADELSRMGFAWDYRISDPTDSPPYKGERYAFLWKPSRVKNAGRFWLEESLPETVFREPYVGRFDFRGQVFLIANFHARRGADKPEEEIPLLATLPARYPDDQLIFLGDFNLEESHPAFDPLEALGYSPVLTNQATSLRQSCSPSYFSGALDNIYLPATVKVQQSGIIDIVGDCDNLKEARKLSDHVPVWMAINFFPRIP